METANGIRGKHRMIRDYDEDFHVYEKLSAQGIPVPVAPSWVSAFFGLSKVCLCEWRQKGIGPKWYRIGRSIRYDFKDVIDYFQNGEQQPPKEFPKVA